MAPLLRLGPLVIILGGSHGGVPLDDPCAELSPLSLCLGAGGEDCGHSPLELCEANVASSPECDPSQPAFASELSLECMSQALECAMAGMQGALGCSEAAAVCLWVSKCVSSEGGGSTECDDVTPPGCLAEGGQNCNKSAQAVCSLDQSALSGSPCDVTSPVFDALACEQQLVMCLL